jgi:hypothetical protein
MSMNRAPHQETIEVATHKLDDWTWLTLHIGKEHEYFLERYSARVPDGRLQGISHWAKVPTLLVRDFDNGRATMEDLWHNLTSQED